MVMMKLIGTDILAKTVLLAVVEGRECATSHRPHKKVSDLVRSLREPLLYLLNE